MCEIELSLSHTHPLHPSDNAPSATTGCALLGTSMSRACEVDAPVFPNQGRCPGRVVDVPGEASDYATSTADNTPAGQWDNRRAHPNYF